MLMNNFLELKLQSEFEIDKYLTSVDADQARRLIQSKEVGVVYSYIHTYYVLHTGVPNSSGSKFKNNHDHHH